MADIIGLLFLILGLAIGLRGLALFVLNRDSVGEVVGFNIPDRYMYLILVFFSVILTAFFLILFLNHAFGFIQFEFDWHFWGFLRSFLGDLSSAFLEELFFRVFMFMGLVGLVGNKYLIVLIAALFFAAFHFPSGFVQFLSFLLGGVIYGLAYVKFRSLFLPIFLHFTWNFVQGTLLGFSVSGNGSTGLYDLVIVPDLFWNGGSFGLEGSWIGIVVRVLLLCTVYLFPAAPKNDQFLVLKRSY